MQAVNLLPAGATRGKRWGAVADGQSPKRVRRHRGRRGRRRRRRTRRSVRPHAAASSRTGSRRSTASREQVAAAEATAASAQAARASAQARRVAVTTVTSQRVTWEQVLRDLARVLPSERLARRVSRRSRRLRRSRPPRHRDLDHDARRPARRRRPSSSPAARARRSAVARVIDRLSVLPWLSDVSLQQSTRADTGTGGLAVQFTIGANLSSTGGK